MWFYCVCDVEIWNFFFLFLRIAVTKEHYKRITMTSPILNRSSYALYLDICDVTITIKLYNRLLEFCKALSWSYSFDNSALHREAWVQLPSWLNLIKCCHRLQASSVLPGHNAADMGTANWYHVSFYVTW